MAVVRVAWVAVAGAALLAACASPGPVAPTPPFEAPSSPSLPTGPATEPATLSPAATPTPPITVGDLPAECTGAADPSGTPPSGSPVAVQRGQTIDLVGPSGNVVNQTGADVTSGLVVAGLNADALFLYHPSTGDLSRLGLSGAVVDLGTTMASPPDSVFASSFAVSPNGKCWLMAAPAWGDGADAAATTAVYGGVIGGAALLVATLVRAGEASVAYSILRWDVEGVLLGSEPDGSGGAGPFVNESALAAVVRFDPSRGSVSPPLCSGRFGDVAPDGTLACVSGGLISVTRPDGSTVTVATGATQVGQVAFAAGSSTLTYCTASAWSGVGDWADALTVVDVAANVPQVRQTADYQDFENALAFDKVVDGDEIVELEGATTIGGSPTSLAVISLGTGAVTPIGPPGLIIGVL